MPRSSTTSSGSSKPSFIEDRVAWNQAWERDLAYTYGTEQTIRLTPTLLKRIGKRILDRPPPAAFDAIMNDGSLQTCQVVNHQTCVLQKDLTKKVITRFTVSDFENRWRECGPKEREKWILEGLVRTCLISPFREKHREFCPEITIARMNYQSGQGFLDLIRQLVGKDAEQIVDEVRTVPNPIWDIINSSVKKDLSPGQRVFQRAKNVDRASFITFVCWHVLLAFYGQTEQYFSMKLRDTTLPYEPYREAIQEAKINDKEMAARFRQHEKSRREYLRSSVHACLTCNRRAEDVGMSNLLACQKCKGISRYVFYCSKECQAKDWKHGVPPHKTICGSTSALADSVLGIASPPTSAPGDNDTKWGAPDPGFSRSLALLYQLKVLDKYPHCDYLLVRSEPEFTSDVAVQFEDSATKKMFLEVMQKASCRHAPKEVEKMYQMLLPFGKNAEGVGKHRLKQQLKNEYGVDVGKDELD
ncbi:hypothetical protein VKT23_008482 [Stygiomarasmius scandens]|uniref:MYND-type domain-containing protein n=1 Tax=Marasmiellus scandens TaxID=2682957 RepID=A0ABR1JGI9_9AGAR